MSKNILLIEDNLEMRENTSEILELSSYNVITAENGKEGVEKAMSLIPDLIICDIMMPEMDGYEVLFLLSKNKITRDIPFVFLTAKSSKSDLRHGMNLGADDYLMKPFDDMELLKAIEVRLKKNELTKQHFHNNLEDVNAFLNSAEMLTSFKLISDNKKIRKYQKKEILFREGDYCAAVFFIVKGKIKTFKTNENLKKFTTGLYKQGDFVGHISLIEGKEYQDSAVIMEEAEVYRIHKDDFTSLLFNNREIAISFIKLLSGNIIEKENELLKLAYDSVRKRVADGLLLLQKKFKTNDDSNFSISIPRDDLASLVGNSTESVIRVISEFKEEKLIAVKGSNISILNENQLKNLKGQ